MNIQDLIVYTNQYGDFYSHYLRGIPRIKSNAIDTMCVSMNETTGKIGFMYNQEFMDSLTVGEACMVIMHECLHLALNHCTRGRNHTNQLRSNAAADFAVNSFLKPKDAFLSVKDEQGDYRKIEFKLPDGCLLAEDYGYKPMLSFEEYYELIKDDNRLNGSQGFLCRPDGTPIPSTFDPHQFWKEMSKTPEGRAELERLQKQATRIAREHNSRGNNIGGLLQELEALDPLPKYDWRKELRLLNASLFSIKKEESFKKSNRRLSGEKYFYPGKKHCFKPNILVVRDTSGSMALEELQQKIISEIFAINRSAHIEVCDCDVEMTEPYPVRSINDLRSFTGGGGTSFIKPFEYALNKHYDGIIYLTDLFGEFPSKEQVKQYANKTLWVCFGDDYWKDGVDMVPFGKIIIIEDD